MRFSGQRVLVTGAARHTGLGIARAFAAEGATVILNDRTAVAVAEAAAELRGATGARVVEAVADIADRSQADAMFDMVRRECGGLDVLVNNAAHLGVGPSFLETSPGFLAEVVGVNLLGTFYSSQHAARLMVEPGRGAIVFLGSNTSERPIRKRSAYIASKGALDALTRALALELAPYGVRVNMVVAGYIHTTRWDALSPAQVARRRANVPLGCEASAADVAAAVLFLASSAAAQITGARLVVDGGVTSQLLPADAEV